MAIARCESHGKPKTPKIGAYSDTPHLPVGHPNSGVVCGKRDCDKPGIVWLKTPEEADYEKGQRVFEIHTRTAKVRVQ